MQADAEAPADPPPREPDGARAPGIRIDGALPSTREPVRCPHFGPCGGCQLLDAPYAHELRWKEGALRRLIRGRGALREAELLPLLAADEPLFYRTSLKLPFGTRAGAPVAGFYRPRTHRIVDLHVCAIQHPLLTRLLVAARRAAAELGTPIDDERGEGGLLRHLVARLAPSTGELLAGLVVREAGRAETRVLAETLFERFRRRGLVGVVENENRVPGSGVLGPRTLPVCGRSELLDTAGGLSVRTSLTTFVQANAAMAEELYAEVLRLVSLACGRAPQAELTGLRVVDLFSGFGPIALRLARRGAEVVAVERGPIPVAEGSAAAEASGLSARVRYVAGDAGHGLAALARERFDAAVLDPPRRGLAPGLVRQLRESSIPRLAYVSCNPRTLARDLDELSAAFRPRWVRGVDLFPRTEHLEAVALLERRAEPDARTVPGAVPAAENG